MGGAGPTGTGGHAGGTLAQLHLVGGHHRVRAVSDMTIEAATDRDVFQAFVDQVLCPRLRPGQIVVLDNLSAHKAPAVRQSIEAAGASLLYLPPYSPDLNPIEKCWSKIKQVLRSLKARTAAALESAMSIALAAISPENAHAWFQYCGYTKY